MRQSHPAIVGDPAAVAVGTTMADRLGHCFEELWLNSFADEQLDDAGNPAHVRG
jgi:hypothetical protein